MDSTLEKAICFSAANCSAVIKCRDAAVGATITGEALGVEALAGVAVLATKAHVSPAVSVRTLRVSFIVLSILPSVRAIAVCECLATVCTPWIGSLQRSQAESRPCLAL